MGTKLQARIMHSIAEHSSFDGVGRIFVPDAQKLTRNDRLTASDILDLWQEYYPEESADEKQFNLVYIYFDGKEATHNTRSVRPVIPEREVLPAADGEETFHAAKPEQYEPADFQAENPEDRIIL